MIGLEYVNHGTDLDADRMIIILQKCDMCL